MINEQIEYWMDSLVDQLITDCMFESRSRSAAPASQYLKSQVSSKRGGGAGVGVSMLRSMGAPLIENKKGFLAC